VSGSMALSCCKVSEGIPWLRHTHDCLDPDRAFPCLYPGLLIHLVISNVKSELCCFLPTLWRAVL
jgi:hypothetical protein